MSHVSEEEALARQRIGEIIDRYQIDDLLGAGGFGAVYRATHRVMGRSVALKLLHAQTNRGDIRQRFIREAQAAASVGHPGIVQVYDCGVTPEGEAFLAMELMEGEDLQERLKKRGRLPWEEARAIVVETLDALSAAHEAGVVHRDLKPANLFLQKTPQGERIKILDFGISKLRTKDSNELTRTGMVMGTPHYMPPEAFTGSKHLDQRADVYAMATILYELISGRPPHDAESYEELVIRVATQPAPSARTLNGLPLFVAEAIDRGLAATQVRFASADAFKKALESPGASDPAFAPTGYSQEGFAPTGISSGTAPAKQPSFSEPSRPHPSAPAHQAPASPPNHSAPQYGGAPVPRGSMATPMPQQGSPYVPPTYRAEPEKPRSNAWIFGFAFAGLLVVVGLAIVVGMMLTRGPKDSGEPSIVVQTQPAPVQQAPAQPAPMHIPQPAQVADPAPNAVPNQATLAPTPAPAQGVEPAPVEEPAVRVQAFQVLGDHLAGPAQVIADQLEAAPDRLRRCATTRSEELYIQILSGPNGRFSIVQPSPVEESSDRGAAVCAAGAVRIAGPFPTEQAGGIVTYMILLAPR